MTNLFAEKQDFIRRFIPPKANQEVILVDVTNIAHWVDNHDRDYFNSDDWIPNLPWDTCWFEYYAPNSGKRGGEYKSNMNPLSDVMGILSMYNSKDNTNTYQLFSTFKVASKDKFVIDEWEEPPGIRWLGGKSIPVDFSNNGKVVISPFVKDLINKGRITQEKAKTVVEGEVLNALFSSTFSHCKNVTYFEKSHPEKLQRANIKRGKIPQETYRVLDIEGLTKQAKSESTKERGELQTALHICRGHFRTYTEENPLFGKVTGTFWVPMHKRGSAEHGEVNKDYRIHAN